MTVMDIPEIQTLADLLEHLGSVPPERIRFHPFPGTAIEADVLAQGDGAKRLCELVDGVLVEKPTGYYESVLAGVLIRLLGNFLSAHKLGSVSGPDGTLRLAPGLLRAPDVCFVSREQLLNRNVRPEPTPDLHPDLAVEVLSKSNTPAEMNLKLQQYFDAGARLVWYLQPASRTVQVYTSLTQSILLTEHDTLDGGEVLPGFQISVREWFDLADEQLNP